MEWNEYFRLALFKETLEGQRPYFQAELKISPAFSFEDLSLEEFAYLNLTEIEKKNFSISLRKIYLSQNYFRSFEFDRIVQNLAMKMMEEKDQLLTFSTGGGGLYLLMSMTPEKYPFLKDKKLICYTSEMPLKTARIPCPPHLFIIYRPTKKTYFRNLSPLWEEIVSVDLPKFSLA